MSDILHNANEAADERGVVDGHSSSIAEGEEMIQGWGKNMDVRKRSIWLHLWQCMLSMVGLLLMTACSRDLNIPHVNFGNFLDGLGPAQGILSLVAIVAGLVLMVAGWKIYRFVVALPGFLIGAALGTWLGQNLVENWILVIVGLAIGGLIGVWLALVVHDIAVFVVGAIGGLYLLHNFWGVFFDMSPALLIEIICGIACGVALLAISKHWIILLSSAIGALMFGWGMHGKAGLIFVLFVLGVILQYSISKTSRQAEYVKSDDAARWDGGD